MRNFYLKIIILFLISNFLEAESLWVEEGNIYSRTKSWKVGDTIKIIFKEKTILEYNNLVSEMTKINARGEGGSGAFINFLPKLGGSENFETSQRASVKNRREISRVITAQVINLLPNKNLQISANHNIIINNNSETITITGEVNPSDIKNKKYVYSTDIINASINYQSVILKPTLIAQSDFVKTYQTNISVVSGKTQINITSQYEISENKRNQLILEYLNKIISILFRK